MENAMSRTLENLERDAFQSFWNDGLLDLMMGLVILVMGLAWWQGVAVMGAVFPAACVAMWYPLRRRLVEPRMGFVEFSGAREVKNRSFRFGLAGFFTGTMVLGLVGYALWSGGVLSRPAEWIAGFPLVLLAIPSIFFALFTRCRRFFWYAFLMMVAAIELVMQDLDPHAGMIACGAVIVVSGVVLLARFLSKYPRGGAGPE